jgi:membrane fusion protein (multidrug efflux system)
MSDTSAESAPKNLRDRLTSKAAVPLLAAVVIAAGGVAYIVSPPRKVTTDNAYLRADASVVATKVHGFVTDILVAHNQQVRRGDPLLRIDTEEYDAKVAAAEAELADALASVEAVQAALVALESEEKLAASAVAADLVATGAVSRSDADRYRTAALSAAADVDRYRAQLEVSRNQAAVTAAKRLSLQASASQAEATVARARAALQLAKQDQAHSTIYAPIDGVVADRQVELGDYVQPGSRLLTVVPLDRVYVVANFKETQTTRMLAGQRADIEIDAYPGLTLRGTVESFAPGSGSQFALIPFEPGTGNFTKIVQRIPVRIVLDESTSERAALRPGLSTSVTVHLDPVDRPRVSGPRKIAQVSN